MALGYGWPIPMSSDAKCVIGMTVGTALALAGLPLTLFSGVNRGLDRLDDRADRIEDRLRAVDIGLAEAKALVSGGGRGLSGGGGGSAVTPPLRGD